MADLLSPSTPGDARPRVMIADKSPVVRSGLRDFIARDGRFDVLDAHAERVQPLSPPRAASCRHRHHRLVAARHERRRNSFGAEAAAHSPTRIIVYTGEPGKDVLRQAVRLGAWGFISKSDEPSMLVDTIAAVARGRMSLPYIDLKALTTDPLARADVARARAADRARQRLDEFADRLAHRHLAQHRQVSPQEPLR